MDPQFYDPKDRDKFLIERPYSQIKGWYNPSPSKTR